MAVLTAALVREQGITFAVALMKNHVITNPSKADEYMSTVARLLGCSLVVLMGESNGKVRGNRRDVVNFVSKLHPAQLPWRKYTF